MNPPKHIVAVSAYVTNEKGETLLVKTTIGDYITRPHMKSRTRDAMRATSYVPYETWEVDTYNLVGRLDL
jgi:hypothetical protein